MPQQRIEFANTLRGIAAVCVLFSHYLGVFWLNQGDVATAIGIPPPGVGVPIYVRLLNAVPWNWGALGVAVFFLISGFVIPFSLYRSTAAGFAVNRLFRIYPVYIVGFTISLAVIYAATRYSGQPWPFREIVVLTHLPGLHDLTRFGAIDGTIWTLEVEIKFYLLCALFIGWFRRNSRLVFGLPLAVVMVAFILNDIRPILEAHYEWSLRYVKVFLFDAPLMPFMFIGTAIHYIYRKVISLRSCTLLCGLYYGFYVTLCSVPLTQPDVYITLDSYALACVCFAACYRWRERFRPHWLTSFLADISYPLYVCHMIIGFVGLRLLVGAGMRASASILIVTAAAVAVAVGLHVLIEAPSQRLYRSLRMIRFSPLGPRVGPTAEQPAGPPAI